MKIFTVTHIDEDDGVNPFVFAFTTMAGATQAIEAHALQLFNALLDPNDSIDMSYTFPGLTWSDDGMKATDEDDGEYWITEARVL